MGKILIFSGNNIDWLEVQRRDENWISDKLSDPKSKVIVYNKSKVLVKKIFSNITLKFIPLGDIKSKGIEPELILVGDLSGEIYLATDLNDFDYVMSLNVRSVINLSKNVVAKMLNNNIKGSIINGSSQMGHVGGPNRTTYCSSKFAIEGFTKALAIELAPNGIRVNTVCPTFIQTPMTEPFLKDEEFKKTTIGMIPLGRLGEVKDLMGPFVFLASEASSLMTGSSLMVDGGWTSR